MDTVDSPPDQPPAHTPDAPSAPDAPQAPSSPDAPQAPGGPSDIELLVFVDRDRAPRVVEALRHIAAVTQMMPPRLVLVALDDPAPVARTPGVVGVFTPGQHPDVPGLTGPEQIFVAGWELRQRPKHRPGDGAPWDGEGYDPPDPPGPPRPRP